MGYPRYAFELDWRPLPAMKDVISTFAATDPMRLAAWFESTSSFLGGRRPREVIAEDGSKVLEAVRDLRLQQGSQMFIIVHDFIIYGIIVHDDGQI